MTTGRTAVAAVSAAFLALLAFIALAAPSVAPADPVRQDLEAVLSPPLSPGHALGTDELGRDVLSRILYGSRSALLIGATAAVAAALLGGGVGVAAALGGGLVDGVLMTAMDAVLAFPTILAAMTVVAVFGFGLGPVAAALAVVYSPSFAKLARAEALVVRTEGYVAAARSFGLGPARVALRHVVPNIGARLGVHAATVFSMAVSVEASLSYLGLGTQPPDASWGLMLKDARNYLLVAPWLSVFPGLAVFLTVLAASSLGDVLSSGRSPRRGKA